MNSEFLIHLTVSVSFMLIIAYTLKILKYNTGLLWILTIFNSLHLAWGWLSYDGVIWYQQIIFPLSDTYQTLRYDQILHCFGYFTATILAYEILVPRLKTRKVGFALAVILIMAGTGFGALNEVIEFIIWQVLPESGVGGYINTSIDMIANLVWATIAVIFIKLFYPQK